MQREVYKNNNKSSIIFFIVREYTAAPSDDIRPLGLTLSISPTQLIMDWKSELSFFDKSQQMLHINHIFRRTVMYDYC